MKTKYWAIMVAVFFLLPTVITSPYHRYVLALAGLYSILTIGLNFVMGLAGQISLAHSAFWGIGAYAAALSVLRLNAPFVVSLMVGTIAGAIGGLVLGIPSLKVRSFYLSITTLGFNSIVNLVMNNWTGVTGGFVGLRNIPPPSFGPFVLDSPLEKAYLILACVLLSVWVFARIKDSRVGRALQALRGNELAAELMGVNVHYYKVLAFVLSAAVAGLAGSVFAHFMGYISPVNFMQSESFVILCMLLLGGSGSIWGPVIGASLLVILPEWLRFLKDYYVAVYGIAVAVMAIKMPMGLVGLGRILATQYGPRIRQLLPQRRAAKGGEVR